MLALLSVLIATGCKSKLAVKPVAESWDPNEVTVTNEIAGNLSVGTPEYREVHGMLDVAAHVETDARNIARVGSPVTGRIMRLLVFEGQQVRAGATLAVLHTTDLSDTQFAFVKASSLCNLAEAAVSRAGQLVSADVIGKAEVERRRAELVQASTEAASYRTQLLGLGMSETQIHQLEVSGKLSADYPVIAPKTGTLLKREVTIGQVVQPADPAFTIANLSTVWITANVPEEEAGVLHKGMAVDVLIPALPDLKIHGTLSYVSPIVDPATRTVEVRMDYNNSRGSLKPDQLANMTFTGHKERKLTVPDAAVVRETNKDYIFVAEGQNRYIMREVSLGEDQDDHRVVLGGLRPEERIIIDGAFHLNNQRKQNAIKGGE
ncbi:efflux RND transporter periplasmic adaptor subunit [Bryocella elongata]|nr:efflux RND transporter periplasmic adaptor subunit [Bryocella elongata]